jgi:hypothetical protein
LRIVHKVLICLFPILPMSLNSEAFFIASLTDTLNYTSMHFFSGASLLLLRLGIRKTPFASEMSQLGTCIKTLTRTWVGG